MADTLILDAEAVAALAWPQERAVLAERARALLTIAREREAIVRVPVGVLAEVCRGQRRDAAVAHLLNGRGIEVEPLTTTTARQAGALLHVAGLDSADAVDAFVVATAIGFGRAVIATSDPDDLARLAANHPDVIVVAL